MSLLLLIALIAVQDAKPDVKAIIEQLGADDLATRGEALERLYRLGSAVRKDLEPLLASRSPDLAASVRGLLERIDRDERLARSLPPERFVTIPKGAHTLGKLLEQIREQTGVLVVLEDIATDSRVDGGWEQAPLLRMLDEMCRKIGRGSPQAPSIAPRIGAGREPADHIVIHTDQPLPAAIAYSRQFRAVAWPLDAKDRLVVDANADDRPGVYIDVQTLPGFKPIYVGPARVTEVVDDKGASLLTRQHVSGGEFGEPETGDHAATVWFPTGVSASVRPFVPAIAQPTQGATRLRMKATLRIAVAIEDVTRVLKVSEFDAPVDLAFGATTIRVTRVTARPDGFTMDYSVPAGARGSPRMELLDARGAPLALRTQDYRTAGERTTATWMLGAKDTVHSVRIKAHVGYRAFDVPFEWTDIPLPRGN